jgi:hypothetical protein
MALMSDIVYNRETKRHELDFVNQQFDYLMSIKYDDQLGGYKFNCSEETVKRIGKDWGGRDFDIEYWLKLAAKELSVADNKLTTSQDNPETQ